MQATPKSTFKILVASRSFGKNCPETITKMKAEGCLFLPGFDTTPSEDQLIAAIGEADVLLSGTALRRLLTEIEVL